MVIYCRDSSCSDMIYIVYIEDFSSFWKHTSHRTVYQEEFPLHWEHWYYNKGRQEVVISILFVKIKTNEWFAKLLRFEPIPAGTSQILSYALSTELLGN